MGFQGPRPWLLGFVFASTLAPDILPHCPFVFLRSNVCLPPFRAASLRSRPGGSATVGVTSPRREPFIPIEQTSAGHTSAGFRACGFTELSSSVSRIALGTGKSPEPADKNVCATALNRQVPVECDAAAAGPSDTATLRGGVPASLASRRRLVGWTSRGVVPLPWN